MEKIANPVRSDTKVLYNEELRDALRGIYEVYGSDLGAFFRDASEKKHTNERHAKASQTKRTGTAAKRKTR
jgi:hypothetical protein